MWEAKYSILSNAQLLNASGAGLMSKEGIWISLKEDNYAFHKAKHWSWQALQENDHINEVREIASRKRLITYR